MPTAGESREPDVYRDYNKRLLDGAGDSARAWQDIKATLSS
jgi:hypothetical protein